MRLNAAMLCEALTGLADVVLIGEARQEHTLWFPYFYYGIPGCLRAGGVYLSPPEELPQEMPAESDLLWAVWGEEEELPPQIGPVLLFRGETDPLRVLNLIQLVFTRFTTWEEQLDKILEGSSSVKELIEASEPLFSHPLCVVDASMNYLGYSLSFMSKGREIFFPESGGAPQPPAPGGGTPAPALFYDRDRDRIAPLSNQDFTLGTFYMIHSSIPFSATELVLFDVLAEKLSQALRNLSMLSGLYRNSFKHQMELYFQTKQVEEEQLYESLAEQGGRRGDTFICYKVKASHINRKINAEYICSIFENALYSAISFWNDGVLVVLVDVTQNHCTQEGIHKKMEALLNRLQLKAGVSLPFTDLTHAWYHYRQACCAFDEGYPGGENESLYFFQKYVGSYMLHQSLGEFPRAYLLDEGVQRILEHDQAYSVSYLDTLQAFFRCGMNMSQTAELLGIHRTSLNSRMQKIRDCLDHELTQDYLLYLQMVLALLRAQK